MLNRTETFMEIFRNGMIASLENERIKTLGDRNLYLGLSDLAKYRECPRAAVACKTGQYSEDINKLIAFGRGHWFENGVAYCFTALGIKQLRQVEVSYQYQEAIIKGHIDIALVWEKPYPAVRILEIKSMENLPSEPYQSHQWQISAQTELLNHCWNKPVFGFANSEKMTFPALCEKELGISLPANLEEVSVEGWLLCLSMSEAKVFGPFNSDREFMEDLNITVLTVWRQIEGIRSGEMSLNDIPHAQGFYPLCSWCEVNRNCPKFTIEAIQQEFEPMLARLDQLKDSKATLEREIRELETGIKLAHQNSGVNEWISTDKHRFRVINAKGRTTLDVELLRAELEDLFHDWKIESDTVEALLERCGKIGAPSSRLSIQKVRQEN